jgi:hypothetical protein
MALDIIEVSGTVVSMEELKLTLLSTFNILEVKSP